MNPFDYRVSNVITEERLKQADYQRHLHIHGTYASVSSRRKAVVSQTMAKLRQIFGLNTQPKMAESASHLS